MLAAVAVWFLTESRPLDYQSEFGRPGPGFFPTWLSAVLLVVAILLFARATWQVVTTLPTVSGQRAKHHALKKPLLVIAAVAATVPSLPVAGFPLTVALFLVFVLAFVERIDWWVTMVIAVFGSGFLYVLFGVCLQIQLPMGVVIRP